MTGPTMLKRARILAAALAAAVLLGRPGACMAHARRRRVVRTVIATAYCMGPCWKCETRGRTFMGARRKRGVAVARLASRRALPLGSAIYIPGYGRTKV